PRYDWLLLLLLLFYPAQFIHANTIEPEILLQSFVLLYIHGFVQFFRKRETKYVWLMSAALCLGLFVKPVLYPYTAIHVLLIVVTALRIGYRHNRRGYPVRTRNDGAAPHCFRGSHRRDGSALRLTGTHPDGDQNSGAGIDHLHDHRRNGQEEDQNGGASLRGI